ncbi:hypothetical protein D9M70_637500 [compost metagenome]
MQVKPGFLGPIRAYAVNAPAFQVQDQRLTVHCIVIHHQHQRLGCHRRTHDGQCLALGVAQDVVLLRHAHLVKKIPLQH